MAARPRRTRAARFPAGLRREAAPLLALAALVLVLQLLLAGFSQGAMAAAALSPGTAICHGDGISTAPGKAPSGPDCPCLAASGCLSAFAVLSPGAGAAPRANPALQAGPAPRIARHPAPERRPLRLFARGPTSPPDADRAPSRL
ncbi:hypothetical protein [Aurantimonas sp. Leaf443]|uniref:hypothetical protein n=1 Tax=Aurantimonas sp. Leaf443 TaxID=1736378 RepID=UPI0006F54347|nr:hypothetical protein [Aurantimonas sp. Leaf443]KQT82224.1 hypothetical protein ASG48_16465 [Aurantimonas sp. Leaf443]